MKLQAFLKIANELENSGAAFFNRCGITGDDGEIYFRMAHGNDPTPYKNARNTELKLLQHRIRSSTDFATVNGTLRMFIKNIYKDAGAK